MASMTLSALCWCERMELQIPVQWVSEARTGSCGPNCGPGCPSRADGGNAPDSFDDLTEVARTGKKTKMKRFNPKTYDPRVDSSFGYSNGSVRTAHPHGVVLQVVGGTPPLCACGCGEPPRGKGATFGMGHDARLRGKLSRAVVAQCQVVLTDVDKAIVEVLDPLDYADRFSTDKLDWRASVQESAKRSRRSDGEEAERTVLKRALGPQVGDTKLIKVGRWEKTGRIVAVYEDKGEVLYEYVDAAGVVRQARQGADGKVRAEAS